VREEYHEDIVNIFLHLLGDHVRIPTDQRVDIKTKGEQWQWLSNHVVRSQRALHHLTQVRIILHKELNQLKFAFVGLPRASEMKRGVRRGGL
jgi:hypothetical protein